MYVVEILSRIKSKIFFKNKQEGLMNESMLPSISTKGAVSAQIIQLALEKLFSILTKMAGEKK